MAWWRSKEQAGAKKGGLSWSLTPNGNGGSRLTVTLHEKIPGAQYPRVVGFALSSPYGGELAAGWSNSSTLRAERGDGDHVQLLGHFLIPPPRNIGVGETTTTDISVPPASVSAVLFGSLTNRIWIESGQDHLWLVNHERTPRLDDWQTQIGTDPLMHRSRLVVDDGKLSLEELETVRMSELPDDGAG